MDDAWIWLIVALPIIALIGGALSTAMKRTHSLQWEIYKESPLRR
jgi:hypothetical protein